MTTEREKPRTLALLNLNMRRIGNILFNEAIEYDNLSVNAVGKHTSFLIHDYPGNKKGQWISIHFRRNLGELEGEGLGRASAFLGGIGEDLHLLAKALNDEPRLKKVREIIGLSHLSAAW